LFKPTLNVTEQVASRLAQQIICGTLPGGARIQELKIATRLGVSRGSVREALLILERHHLIEIVPRRGAVVNPLPCADALELVDLLAAMELRCLRELLNHTHRASVAARAGQSVVLMERGAREADEEAILVQREAFYVALLSVANRYTVAVFESVLPSSQRVLSHLVRDGQVDLHDIARYYKALHQSIVEQDEQRLDELLGAFRRRLQTLCRKSFQGERKCARKTRVPSWTGAAQAVADLH
jgi:DNA-binding GntR family transcriptional regulator